MSNYKFDSARWCLSRAKSARLQRNFTDADNFLSVATEIEVLKFGKARHDELREAVAWERECLSQDMIGLLSNNIHHLYLAHGFEYLDSVQEEFEAICKAARAEVDRLVGDGE